MVIVLCYAGLLVFIIGFAYRTLSIARMPAHLRWELAPIPHEKGKSHYGGSYLEEVDWWTKPREKSLVDEAVYMFKEIVLLKGVYEHNRGMWILSFPLHSGLYLLIATVGCLALAALGLPFFGAAAHWLGGAAFVLGSIGSIGLMAKRALDPNLKPFSTPASYLNLASLVAVFVSGGFAWLQPDFVGSMTAFLKAFVTADTGFAMSPALAAHVFFVALFLIYLPFTQMMHFVAKYFTYHQVRWNDAPMRDNAPLQEEVKALLSQPVTWSAPHIDADGKKNWVDIATADMSKAAKAERAKE